MRLQIYLVLSSISILFSTVCFAREWDRNAEGLEQGVLLEYDSNKGLIVVGSTAPGLNRGKEFTVPVSQLSESDLAFVRRWASAAAIANDPSADREVLSRFKRNENGDVTFDLGVLLAKSMEFDDAAEAFGRSIDVYEEMLPFRKEVLTPLVASLTNRAVCLLRKGKESASIKLLQRAVELDSKSPWLRANLEIAQPLMPESYRRDIAELITATQPVTQFVGGLAFLSRADSSNYEHYTDACLVCDATRHVKCDQCRGQGRIKQTKWVPKAFRTGRNVVTRRMKVGYYVGCSKCGGSESKKGHGRVSCPTCRGSGKDPRFPQIANALRLRASTTATLPAVAGTDDVARGLNQLVTSQNYNAIQPGMHIDQVLSVLGPGKETLRLTSDKTRFSTYIWGNDENVIIVTLANERVAHKTKIGLN